MRGARAQKTQLPISRSDARDSCDNLSGEHVSNAGEPPRRHAVGRRAARMARLAALDVAGGRPPPPPAPPPPPRTPPPLPFRSPPGLSPPLAGRPRGGRGGARRR